MSLIHHIGGAYIISQKDSLYKPENIKAGTSKTPVRLNLPIAEKKGSKKKEQQHKFARAVVVAVYHDAEVVAVI